MLVTIREPYSYVRKKRKEEAIAGLTVSWVVALLAEHTMKRIVWWFCLRWLWIERKNGKPLEVNWGKNIGSSQSIQAHMIWYWVLLGIYGKFSLPSNNNQPEELDKC